MNAARLCLNYQSLTKIFCFDLNTIFDLCNPGAREEAGLPRDTGPYRVVTNLCVMGYDDETKRMKLLSLNPGVTKEKVIENTGFELLFAENITQNEPPTDEELRILREKVDPDGLYR